MQPGEAVADIVRDGDELAASLLRSFDPTRGRFGDGSAPGIAAHQFLWRHYMETGQPAYGEAVLASLRLSRCVAADPSRETNLGEMAQTLELLTWVWRQCRCPELRQQAEDLASAALTRMRVPGFGFSASCGKCGDDAVRADLNGLMLVALIEAGSVLERRDCLVAAREVFDEIVAHLGTSVEDGRLGDAGTLDDHAMMSRAAIRHFEAFGKRRYLELAETWVARLDEAYWEPRRGGYRADVSDTVPVASIVDADVPSGNALMIGVLARLQSLTDAPRHAARAEQLVGAFHDAIKRSAHAAATAVACVQTLSRPVFIQVCGDPKLEETRELMRVALDCGLPDRIVLGPGAGDPSDASPRTLIRLGVHRLPPITDAARLHTLVAPGGLRNAV